jgi:hypothetical protein
MWKICKKYRLLHKRAKLQRAKSNVRSIMRSDYAAESQSRKPHARRHSVHPTVSAIRIKKCNPNLNRKSPIFALEMKKYLLIFLAFQILATSSPTGYGMQTLLKMGAFFHHFVQHLACHQEKIGIVDFVHLHYSDHEHHEADLTGHQNLPFQHQHDQQNLAPQTPCLLPPFYNIAAFPKLEIVSNPLIFLSQQGYSSSYSGDIWQPPKA